MNNLTFSEEDIQKLFGNEAAENEDFQRLREYYFKTSIYEQIANDLPLRILVGHKGIGKSALFKVAIGEDRDNQKLAILIKPDDIADLITDSSDFLKIIRQWKEGLTEIIAKKVLNAIGANSEAIREKLIRFGGKVVEFFMDTFKDTAPLNLSQSNKIIVETFLKTQVINVYIDDLDRGWEGRREDTLRISALLNAVRDIVTDNRGIRFRISLRSDVFFLVRTSDESTDKIEGSVLWHSWTNHEIFLLLIKRIETFFGRSINEQKLRSNKQKDLAHYLDTIMEPRFSGQGLWENAPMYRVLMSVIRKRPRDLVKLCSLAARNAREKSHNLIYTVDFRNIFCQYSQGRVQDTINEFRSELPDIERLILNMKPNKKERTTKEGYVYSTALLLKKIDNIKQSGAFKFRNGKEASVKELAAFLYKINFLTARKMGSEGIIRSYFEENRYLSNEFVDFGFDWEIHPAYRWALQPDNIESIYQSVELSNDN